MSPVFVGLRLRDTHYRLHTCRQIGKQDSLDQCKCYSRSRGNSEGQNVEV